MKGTITVFSLMIISMSFFSYSYSQVLNFESLINTQCSWNEETQVKDICEEVLSVVQIEINRPNKQVLITSDGFTSIFIIDAVATNNSNLDFSLTSADGTSWVMSVNTTMNTIWMDMIESHFTDSISYIISK